MNYKAIIEAILFTMGESVELEKISSAIDLDRKQTKKIIEELQKEGEKNAMNISTNAEQNVINENEDNSNLFEGILTLALLGGGYCGYKKLKK